MHHDPVSGCFDTRDGFGLEVSGGGLNNVFHEFFAVGFEFLPLTCQVEEETCRSPIALSRLTIYRTGQAVPFWKYLVAYYKKRLRTWCSGNAEVLYWLCHSF